MNKTWLFRTFQATPFRSFRAASFQATLDVVGTGSSTSLNTASNALTHLAIDVGGFIGSAQRMLKFGNPHLDPRHTERRTEHETAKLVLQLVNGCVKRFSPSKSIAFMMDGSEPLWVAAKARHPTGQRRMISRSDRIPGSNLTCEIEDTFLDGLLDNTCYPREVVFSGPQAAGIAELKMGAWLRALSDRGSTDMDKVGIIGSGELFMSLLGSPLPSTFMFVQHGSDFKGTTRDKLLQALVSDPATIDGGSISEQLCNDLLFLLLLSHGHNAFQLPAMSNLQSTDLFAAFSEATSKHELISYSQDKSGSIPTLHLSALASLLHQITLPSKQQSSATSKSDLLLHGTLDYLTMVLEVHSALSHGHISNWEFEPQTVSRETSVNYPFVPNITMLRDFVLQSLHSSSLPNSITPVPGRGAMTAAEYSSVIRSMPDQLETISTQFIGQPISTIVATRLTDMLTATGALSDIRSLLRFANPSNPHRSLTHRPTICVLRTANRGRVFPIELRASSRYL